MYTRLCTQRLAHLTSQFPSVLILGAHQVGNKTTLARQTFASHAYLDLEDSATYALFAQDPRFQLDARAGANLILDEAQRLPSLFDALRGAIDARQRMGRFVILGSAQPTLVRQVSESLAGRVGILELSTSPYLARGLRAIMDDTDAASATIVDQGPGVDPLAPGVARRGFGECTNWLPGA